MVFGLLADYSRVLEKKVRSIWICMDSEETEDSIEEICFDRKTVYGNKGNSYHTDLMKGIIVNIRGEADSSPGKAIKKSQNVLIAMLEELASHCSNSGFKTMSH